MAQPTEEMLRKSLDAADRHRRRLTWVLILSAIAVAWEFFRLAQVRPTGDVPGMIVQAVIVLFFSLLGLAVLLVFQMTIATKRILRAIELASRASD